MVNSVLGVVFSCFIALKAAEQPVSASCPFIMTPSRVVVKYGDPFSVNCSSTTDQRLTMGWESSYKGTGIIPADFVQLDIEKTDRWSIHSTCFMNLKDSSQCLEDLPIIIYKMPERVSITSPNPLVEGRDYKIQCDVVDVAPAKNLFVTWYIDERVHSVEKFTQNTDPPVNLSSVFSIRADKTYHQVKIMCEAKFNFGPTGPFLLPIRSTSAELQVQYAPVFKKPLEETVEVPADRKITLDCTTKGNPAPSYTWNAPEPTQQKVVKGPVLELTNPFPGSYNCTASNSQGNSTKRFIVKDAPRDFTVLAAVVAVAAVLGLALLISGPFIVTKDGTFSCNKSDYMRPSSQPI